MSLVKIHNGLDINITNDRELEEATNMCLHYMDCMHLENANTKEINIKLNLLSELMNLYECTYIDSTPIYKY